MKIELEQEVETLGDIYRVLMFQRRKSYRDVASETGVHLTSAWRFGQAPFSLKADSFIALWRWTGLNEAEIISLWKRETLRRTHDFIYPNFIFNQQEATSAE